MANTGTFIDTPLAVWVSTFSTENVDYKRLSDGVFLNDVMRQIDPRCISDGITSACEDFKERLNNWDILMRNIKAYYQDVLQQFIVMRLPNILTICRAPDTDAAKEELRKVLLLILGCAVQCERKEQFIENIKMLDISTQHGIVEFIKEITDDTKNVFAIDVPLEQMDDVSRAMHFHLRMLIQERDGYMEDIKELSQTTEDLEKAHNDLQVQQAQRLQASPGASPEKQEKQHLSVELAEIKSKMRKLRTELEEKSEYSVELEEELEEYKTETQKLRVENLELTQDARAVRTYRDELDILKEKAARVDKFEAEITKYKERLNELDFYKTRVDEIRDDNQLLVEQRNVLEEQLDACRKRNETVVELEAEMRRFKQHAGELTRQLDLERERIAELTEINARLEFDKKGSLLESATLEEELVNARLNKRGTSGSISDQLNETANAKLLRLELENKRLMKRLAEQKEVQLVDNSAKFLELEKENLRLSKKIEEYQDVKSKDTKESIVLEQVNIDLKHQVENLEETIETVRESADRQVKELGRENVQLQETIQTLRERNEKTHDVRLKEIERENKRLSENIKVLTANISKVEYEKRTVKKSFETLKESASSVKELEEENRCFEKENEDLRKNLATLELRCDRFEKIEQECLDIEVENQKLNKMVESLQRNETQVESLEQDNINLNVELQDVKRSLEVVKRSSARVADLEHEKDLLNREIQQLKRSMEHSRADKDKQEQLERSLLELDTENQRLQRQCEGLTRKAQEAEKETADLESQLEKYQKAMENMKMSMKKLETIERENKDLEQENTRVHKEKATLDKENKRLKKTVETKEGSVDDLSAKVAHLERENKRIQREAQRSESTDTRVQDLERENTQLVQQATMEKKTISTLREDLVTEKIKSQQVENELQRITHELQKVGLDKDRLIAVEYAQDESKYKALESMMEETYKNTMAIKEEKIAALESRLEESKSRNVKLQGELQSVRRVHEALQQRQEEEVLLHNASNASHSHTLSIAKDRERSPRSGAASHSTRVIMPQPNATKEILELKDQIITVERRNATLEAEAKNFGTQRKDLQQQISSLQSQNSRAQNQLANVQEQFNKLQSQCAEVQVENTTLQSQTASLMSHNATLQKQLATTETAHEQLSRSTDEVNTAHESLQGDHESLEKLHEQLSSEYEALIAEHGSLKQNHKVMRNEMKEMQDRNMTLAREAETISDLKRSLQQDKVHLQDESRSKSALQLEYVQLKEKLMTMENARERSERDYRDLLAEHKAMKSEYNQLKTKHSELKMSFDEYTKQLNAMDIEVTKLASKCESLAQLNGKLEEDNRKLEEDCRNLMMQLQTLLNQNQELLASSLDSKDEMHQKTTAHLEQMQDLRRQKEKLEEKIMEQYKRYDPVKKKSRFSLFKRLGKSKDKKGEKGHSRSLGPNEFAQYVHSGDGDHSSMGSGSQNTDFPPSPHGNKKKKYRRGYSTDASPKLSKKSKALAKSTTALNYMSHEQLQGSNLKGSRGFKSSENLLEGRRDDAVWDDGSEWTMRPGKRKLMSSTSTMTAQSEKTEEDEEDEEDDGMTLEEFLRECDKSPKSRRKWLIENKVDLDVTKTSKGQPTEDPISTVLSPNLGPRSPTVEKADDSLKSSKQRSKSEMNISKLSSYSLSPGNDSDVKYRRESSFTSPVASQRPTSAYITSTPKYNTLGSGTTSQSMRREMSPGSAPRHPSQPSQQQPQPQQPIGGAAPPPRHLSMTPQLNSRSHVNGDYHSNPLRSRSAIGFSSSVEDSHPRGSGLERDSFDGGEDMRRQNSGSSAGSGSIGSYNARQGTSTFQPNSSGGPPGSHHTNGGLNGPHQRQPSSDSSGTERNTAYMTSHSGPPRTPSAARHMSGPQPMKANYIPPEHQNSSASSVASQDQYNPGNVRHLLQSYQRNVQQNQHGSPNSSGQNSMNMSHGGSPANAHPHHQPSPSSTTHGTSPKSATSSPYTSMPRSTTAFSSPSGNNSIGSPMLSSTGPKPSSHSQYSSPHLTQPNNMRYQSPPNQPHPSNSRGGGKDSSPVPPPRRTRPVSAGPLKSSSGSAFSAPSSGHPGSPGYNGPNSPGYNGPDRGVRGGSGDPVAYRGKSVPPYNIEGGAPRASSARHMSSRPDERLQPQGHDAPPPPPHKGPAPSPPRESHSQGHSQGHVQGQGPPGEPGKKKPVWYEYGCV